MKCHEANIDEESTGNLVEIFVLNRHAAVLLLSSALVPCLYMICKSFILNLNLIDLADLRMHPFLGVCVLPGSDVHAWGEEIERQTAWGKRLSSLRGGRLTCRRSTQCQVGSEASWAALARALCSPTQLLSVIRSVCKGRHSGLGAGVPAALIERRVLVCKFGGGGGLREALGHMVLQQEGKCSSPRNTCQVSHKQVSCLASLGPVRWFKTWSAFLLVSVACLQVFNVHKNQQPLCTSCNFL